MNGPLVIDVSKLSLLHKAASSAPMREETARLRQVQAVAEEPVDPSIDHRYLTAKGLRDRQGLLDAQRRGLHAVEQFGALVGLIKCGGGKALLSYLVPHAFQIHGIRIKRPLLLLPANLRETQQVEYSARLPHFRVCRDLHLMSYEELSNPRSAYTMKQLAPDLIIADEAHKLADPKSTRTMRLARYLKRNPGTRFVPMSGTLTGRAIQEYAHLLAWALGDRSPLPLKWTELQAWGVVLNARRPGSPPPKKQAFERFCFGIGGPLVATQDDARRLYRERLRSTPGIVSTEDAGSGATLLVRAVPTMLPDVVLDALDTLDELWRRPDGEELPGPLDVARCREQLRQGFFYRWAWPDGIADEDWLEARSDWHRAIRAIVRLGREGIDSPKLVRDALLDGSLEQWVSTTRTFPHALVDELYRAWEAWQPESLKPEPPTEAIWLSEFMIDDVCRWSLDALHAKRRALIWYSTNELAEVLQANGVPVCWPGAEPDEALPVVAVSIASHGTGKNLQAWSANLVTGWPPSGRRIEQLIARTDRHGQQADEILIEFFDHDVDRFHDCVSDARYIADTTGNAQRILFATLLGDLRR